MRRARRWRATSQARPRTAILRARPRAHCQWFTDHARLPGTNNHRDVPARHRLARVLVLDRRRRNRLVAFEVDLDSRAVCGPVVWPEDLSLDPLAAGKILRRETGSLRTARFSD